MSQVLHEYGWKDPGPTGSHEYLLPSLIEYVQGFSGGKPATILDLGCGNGYVASKLAQRGHRVVGVDASREGIDLARLYYPDVQFNLHSLYDDNLCGIIVQPVDCVVSLEVVEHLLYPKRLFEVSYRMLRPGGFLIVSTPYHGYWKNLALSLINGWDRHFKVEWDGGHVKFFSMKTLTRMACEAGFKNPQFRGVGRLPWFWKSMILSFEK